MTNSHMKRNIWWCILLLTAAVFFPLGLSAQEQPQTITQETGFYYTVKEGDTLWDISKQFFDTPWIWPDLWGKNDQLTNPHWIYPGNLLHIYMRGGKVYVDKVDSAPAPPVQPPEQKEPPEPPYFLYTSMEQVGFIRNPAVSPGGKIFKIQGEKQMAGEGDILYVRQEGSDPMTVGSLFTVFRTFAPVGDPTNKKATVGTQHYFTGVAQVTRQEDGYVLAKVIRSYRAIEINDRVMPYEKRSEKIYLPENPPQISGSILLSEERSDLIGEHTIAFIDKGRQDGVMPGQQYRVYTEEKVKLNPEDKKTTLLPPVEVGTLLVLQTEQNTATVVVVGSNTAFVPGTKFTTTLN